jgi:hypothetical protein
MADTDWQLLSKWSETLVHDEDGRVALCFGLAATLYFRDGHTREKRQASLECFNEYDRMCGPSLRWCYASASSSRLGSVEKLRSRDMSPFLLSPEWDAPEAREHGWGFYWHGGLHPDDASPFKIYGYGTPRMYAELDGSLSFLQVSFPVLWFQGKSEGFPELILRWSTRLGAYHGYGGITLIESPDDNLSQTFSTTIAAFGGRYPGIEIDDPMSHKLATVDGIKGGNWLTILSTGFVEKLGGGEILREKLGEPFAVVDYDGGVMVVAGPIPEVGDRNWNADTPLYKRLARVLDPIRIKDHAPPYAEGRFAEEGEYEKWLARFSE